MTPEQAARLRGLITRHAYCQFCVGRLGPSTSEHERLRAYEAAGRATRAVCEELKLLTDKGTTK